MQAYPTCPRCGLLIGDKSVHDNWHRELEAKIARSMYVARVANIRWEGEPE